MRMPKDLENALKKLRIPYFPSDVDHDERERVDVAYVYLGTVQLCYGNILQ